MRVKIVPVKEVLEVLKSNPKYDYRHFLSQPEPNLANLLISRMLTGKGREYVIERIKKPFEKSVINGVKLFHLAFGRVTKETTTKHNTHVILDLKEEFDRHFINLDKKELFDAAWEGLAFENEHDPVYEWIFNWLVTRIAEEKAKGNWIPMPLEFPQEGCWKP